MDGFWEFVAKSGLEANPYRAGFLQLVAVSETDAQAEKDYYQHIRYFYDKCMHILPEFMAIPGHQDYRSLANSVKNLNPVQAKLAMEVPNWKFKDFVDNQFVIAGGPATVRDQLMEAVKKLRVGNLMVLLHIGSMPHELTIKNIELFAREVAPHFRNVWDEDGWDNKWWPTTLRGKTNAGMRTSGAEVRASK
jgi:alkanesulfonate monooxygenase SsuD/methylene tetrahydromethanopterin reductase-like flavin-dependent oxidoreductase (luciferase family)